MNEFRKRLSFIQLSEIPLQHVTTVANSTGEAAVQYFSGQTDVQPDACGSFVKMENDNSRMVGVCGQWGYDGERFPGKWGILAADEDTLYNNSAFVRGVYHWLLIKTPFDQLTWKCDDTNAGVSSGDFWNNIFVQWYKALLNLNIYIPVLTPSSAPFPHPTQSPPGLSYVRVFFLPFSQSWPVNPGMHKHW